MSRLPGKKIDTWKYDKNRNQMDVPVRLVNNHFEVHLVELGISERADTLKDLQRNVFALLDEKLALTWEPYLFIEVSGSTALLRVGERLDEGDYDWQEATPEQRREQEASDTDVEMGLKVSAEVYMLTTNPLGRKLHRQLRFGAHCGVHEGWPETGLEESRYDNDTSMKALVPDTPVAREALNHLSRDLQRLNDRLRELFAPEIVDKTLASVVTGTRLLSAG